MKLIFDQNVSFRVVKMLKAVFPEAKHVNELGLTNFPDTRIWEFARKNGFTIITFDSDFIDLSALRGAPPKIIWY